MTTKLGLPGAPVTVPDPDLESYTRMPQMIGAVERTLGGTRKRHIVAQKATWRARWDGLTTVEKTALAAELNRQSDLVWEPPEGGSFTVQVDRFDLRYFANIDRWCIECDLEQV